MAPVFRRLRAHGGGKLHELPLRGLTSDSSILPLSGTGAGPPRLLGRGEGVPLSASGRAGPSRLEERYMLMVRASPRLANGLRLSGAGLASGLWDAPTASAGAAG